MTNHCGHIQCLQPVSTRHAVDDFTSQKMTHAMSTIVVTRFSATMPTHKLLPPTHDPSPTNSRSGFLDWWNSGNLFFSVTTSIVDIDAIVHDVFDVAGCSIRAPTAFEQALHSSTSRQAKGSPRRRSCQDRHGSSPILLKTTVCGSIGACRLVPLVVFGRRGTSRCPVRPPGCLAIHIPPAFGSSHI